MLDGCSDGRVQALTNSVVSLMTSSSFLFGVRCLAILAWRVFSLLWGWVVAVRTLMLSLLKVLTLVLRDESGFQGSNGKE